MQRQTNKANPSAFAASSFSSWLMLYCPNLHTEWNVLGFVHEPEQEFLLLKSIFSPVRNNLVFNLEQQRWCLARFSQAEATQFFSKIELFHSS